MQFVNINYSYVSHESFGDALRFSFEVNPKSLYKMNNDKLPFGCHGWRKYDPDFWKQFIKE